MPLTFWSNLTGMDAIGFLAALFTVATFAQQVIIPMRCTAIDANVCFPVHASLGHVMPIPTLHMTLLPVNILRLAQAIIVHRPQEGSRAEDSTELPCGLFSIF